ncbi:hypothetical protein PMAYCL1PPCAC_06086 [Pristionchus mayeri]|uniref:Uncharacterized protein n=1 Tax=Pristionchus mayeri TaxID=1317129 RepID=A0AAN4ZB88_9BILA|nr:hypothetical protein PMAYCL1PPCAC_06086 [Pristionchus mayeri]
MKLFFTILLLSLNNATGAKQRVSKEELPELAKYTSLYEVSQIIGEEFRQKYPDIFDRDDLTAFKRELIDYFILTPEEMDKAFAGTHPRFPVLPTKLRQLEPLIEEQFNDLDDEDKEYFVSKEVYLKYLIAVEPVVSLVQSKKAEYDGRGLSQKEIQAEIAENVMRLHNRWYAAKQEL